MSRSTTRKTPITPNTPSRRSSVLSLLLAAATGLALFASDGCGSGGRTIPAATPAVLAAEYAATDIGTPDGYTLDFPAAVNDSGQVVGNWRNKKTGLSHGFLYTPGSGFTDVGALTGAGQSDSVYLFGINNRGQVVGNVNSSPPIRPFLYSDGAIKDLSGFLSPDTKVLGINDSGQIVGGAYEIVAADPLAPLSNAFSRAADGTTQDIGALIPNEIDSYASSVNGSGLTVGFYGIHDNGSYHSRLFEYADGSLTTLTPINNGFASLPKVNSSGQITGTLNGFKSSSSVARAFVYADGSLADIGTLGGLESFSYGISDGGVVVGYSLIDENDRVAFVWRSGQMTNLNAITTGLNGVKLFVANGISPGGVIVAYGYDRSGDSHVFVLRPVTNLNSKKSIIGSAVLRSAYPAANKD